MSTPLKDFLEARDGLSKEAATDFKKRQVKEKQLWETWDQGGRKTKDLKPLITSFRPLVNSRANRWATRLRDVPPAAIRAEFTDQFVKAIHSYDPNRGAQLNTHINHQLKKAQRFCTTYQNPGRIPENRTYKIRQLQDTEERMDEQLGRMPTQLELADKLKWSPREVGVLQKEIRKARPTGQFESDPSAFTPSRQNEVLRLLPYELNTDERQVFEHLYGVGGKTRKSPGQIAIELKMSAPKVSRLKRAIAKKYEQYSE